jgi:hypothetical protein
MAEMPQDDPMGEMSSSQIRTTRLADILTKDEIAVDESELKETDKPTAEGWDEEVVDTEASEGFCIECEGSVFPSSVR